MAGLRIALVIPGIPERSTGPSMWVKDLAHQLCDAGHKVTVVTSDLATGGGSPGPMVEIDRRVTLEFFPVRSALGRRLYYSAGMKRWLYSKIAEFDVVNISGVWSFVTVHAARACHKAATPYVLTPHGQMAKWDWEKSYWRKWVFFNTHLRTVWRSASAINFLSAGEARDSMAEAVEQGVIIPHWVTLPSVGPSQVEAAGLREKLGIPAGCPVLLFLGRISAQKGVLEILAAFDHLWRRRPEAFLLLVGPHDKGYGARVTSVIARLSSKPNIRILDPLYDQRKFTLFSIASLFITLSRNEGLPNAVLEALASGVPVVITEQANLPEVTRFRAGAIVPHEPDAVAAKLEALLADPTGLGRMSAGAKSLFLERFTPEAVMPELFKLYRRVAAGNPRRSKIHIGDCII